MSRMTKSQKRMMVLLMLVLGYAVYDVANNWETYSGFYTGKNKTTAEKKIPVSPNSAVSAAQTSNQNYERPWSKDPFYTEVRQKKVKKRVNRYRVILNLKAISYSGENSVAMINDRILKKGEVISGYKVIKIEPEKVILRNGSETKVLSL